MTHDVVRIIETNGLLLALLLASQSALLVHVLRRRSTEAYSRSWLSTLPVTRAHITRRIARQTFAWPLAALVALTLLLHAASFAMLAGMWLAVLLGSAAGWLYPGRRDACTRQHGHGPGTRRAEAAARRARVPLSAAAPVSASAPLYGWVVAQARIWLRPRTLARSLIPAALALPMGISGNDAIAILVLWAVAIHLVILLRAFVRVAREGAAWLAPTPMPFHRFAWSVARDPLLGQVSWTAGAAVVLIAMGCSPSVAVRIAEAWLALVSVTTALSLVHARRGTPMKWELLGSVCALAAIERFTQHVALPCALAFSAWRLRRLEA